MRFMAVQGMGYWVDDESGPRVHVVVTGDDRSTVVTLRDEVVPALPGPHASDLAWQVDQYTQETIGVVLAADGWEAFSTSALAVDTAHGPATSPVYLVRR